MDFTLGFLVGIGMTLVALVPALTRVRRRDRRTLPPPHPDPRNWQRLFEQNLRRHSR